MSENVPTFEVRVEVEIGQAEYKPICYYGKGEWAKTKILKMFHFARRTPEQAIKAGRKRGKVVSCRKLDMEKLRGNIENLHLDQESVYDLGNPYSNAVTMGEMPWRKQRRSSRLKNKVKDKSNE